MKAREDIVIIESWTTNRFGIYLGVGRRTGDYEKRMNNAVNSECKAKERSDGEGRIDDVCPQRRMQEHFRLDLLGESGMGMLGGAGIITCGAGSGMGRIGAIGAGRGMGAPPPPTPIIPPPPPP